MTKEDLLIELCYDYLISVYSPVKNPRHKLMKIVKITILFCIISISNKLYAENEVSIQERINNAELIVVGDFKSYYQQFEQKTLMENNEIKNQSFICEVYIFSVNKVLKGIYKSKTIEIKLVEECERTTKNYPNDNDREIVANDEEENGHTILFLKKDLPKNLYYSPYGFESLLMVHDTIEVVTDSSLGLVFTNNMQKQDVMTLNDLQNIINNENNDAK